MAAIFKDILTFIQEMGLKNGLFGVFFIFMHVAVFWLYKGRIKDKQAEIDRLAKDNREYRDRFLALMDNAFSYSPPSRKSSPKKVGREKEVQ